MQLTSFIFLPTPAAAAAAPLYREYFPTGWTWSRPEPDPERPDLRSPKHFIEAHRRELVERVSVVDPLVEILKQRDVLNQEEYEKIRAGDIRAEQVRRLLDAVINKGSKAMDVLREALREQDPYLMKDLSQ
uniref:apoptosis-associated speck-like protein containing a CARD n=1 Tax=Pristiophorus japonicus TaxID=55135 RepID=UPI00398F0178